MKKVELPHVPLERLVMLALTGESDPHITECTFCQEQLAFVQALEQESSDTSSETANTPFRLAAASDTEDHSLSLRRTWYLKDRQALVRVFEDEERQLLVGSLLVDPHLYGQVHVSFSGIHEDFVPDEHGRFEIGSLDLDIEPMSVTLSFPLH